MLLLAKFMLLLISCFLIVLENKTSYCLAKPVSLPVGVSLPSLMENNDDKLEGMNANRDKCRFLCSLNLFYNSFCVGYVKHGLSNCPSSALLEKVSDFGKVCADYCRRDETLLQYRI